MLKYSKITVCKERKKPDHQQAAKGPSCIEAWSLLLVPYIVSDCPSELIFSTMAQLDISKKITFPYEKKFVF